MSKLCESDYVRIDGEGNPLDELNLIFSHETLAEWLNEGHLPTGKLVSMINLPTELQALYLNHFKRRRVNNE